jgi:hypothetical protein
MGISTINSAITQIRDANNNYRTVMQFSDVSGNPQGSGVGSILMLTAAKNAKTQGAIAMYVKSAVAPIWETIAQQIKQLQDLTDTTQGEYLHDID